MKTRLQLCSMLTNYQPEAIGLRWVIARVLPRGMSPNLGCTHFGSNICAFGFYAYPMCGTSVPNSYRRQISIIWSFASLSTFPRVNLGLSLLSSFGHSFLPAPTSVTGVRAIVPVTPASIISNPPLASQPRVFRCRAYRRLGNVMFLCVTCPLRVLGSFFVIDHPVWLWFSEVQPREKIFFKLELGWRLQTAAKIQSVTDFMGYFMSWFRDIDKHEFSPSILSNNSFSDTFSWCRNISTVVK